MAKTYAKQQFRIITDAGKLLYDIIEALRDTDKLHRYTIAAEIRNDAEELLHLIRRANDMKAGDDKRIKLQEDAMELLERIRDKIPIYCKACMTGHNKEAQIELSIDNLCLPLHNWYGSDLRAQNLRYEKDYRNAASQYGNAYKTKEIVRKWYLNNRTEKNAIALDIAMSKERIAKQKLIQYRKRFDASTEKEKEFKEQFGDKKDIRDEVLEDIKQNNVNDP